MTPNRDAIMRRLSGHRDPRGTVGMFSRGKNVYNGVSSAAHKGGGIQYGRPKKDAVERRIRRV